MFFGASLLTPDTSPPGPKTLNLSPTEQLEKEQMRDGQYDLSNMLQISSLEIDAIGNPSSSIDIELIGL